MKKKGKDNLKDSQKNNLRKRLLVIFGVFLLLSAVVRMIHPAADAPFDLSWSQGPSTDASYYIEPVVSLLKGGELKPISNIWNAPGYYLLYLPFLKLFGVGFAQLNLATAIISLVGFVFFFLIAAGIPVEEEDVKTALFASLFWAFTTFFAMYNRIPLIYTAMILYMLLSAWLWFLGTKRPLFFILSWLTILLAILYVRVIAIALVPPFLIGHLLLFFGRREEGMAGAVKVATISAVVVAGLILVVFLGKLFGFSPLDIALARVKAHLKGDLLGSGLIVYLFSLGETGGITHYLPVVSILAYSYIIIFVRDILAKRLDFKEGGDVMKVIILAWAVFGALFTILFKYAPPRYFLFLMPPLFILAGMTCARLISPKEKADFGFGYYYILFFWLLFLVFRILLIILSYFIKNFATFAVGFDLTAAAVERFEALMRSLSSFYLLLSLSLILSLLTMAVIYLVEKSGEKEKGESTIGERVKLAFVAVAVVSFLYYQGGIYRGWAVNPHYTLTKTSRELTRLVGEDALVAGPYAHPLTIENDLRRVYLNFTNPKGIPPCEKFEKESVTHFLVDIKSGLVYVEKLFPESFECLDLVDTFYVRGEAVNLYAYKNPKGYTPTDFERARMLMQKREFGDAKELLLKSIGAIEEGTPSSAEFTSLGLCLSMLKDQEGAEEALKKALEINPDNLSAHWGMGRVLDIKGDKGGALFHYRSALAIYPDSRMIKDKIRELIVETR